MNGFVEVWICVPGNITLRIIYYSPVINLKYFRQRLVDIDTNLWFLLVHLKLIDPIHLSIVLRTELFEEKVVSSSRQILIG